MVNFQKKSEFNTANSGPNKHPTAALEDQDQHAEPAWPLVDQDLAVNQAVMDVPNKQLPVTGYQLLNMAFDLIRVFFFCCKKY